MTQPIFAVVGGIVAVVVVWAALRVITMASEKLDRINAVLSTIQGSVMASVTAAIKANNEEQATRMQQAVRKNRICVRVFPIGAISHPPQRRFTAYWTSESPSVGDEFEIDEVKSRVVRKVWSTSSDGDVTFADIEIDMQNCRQ